MKIKKKSIIVFIYNSYKDPLFQNLLLQYIRTLGENGNFSFELVTFEQNQYALTKKEALKEKLQLEASDIYWHPQKFHTGRLLLLKKIYDLVLSILVVTKIKIKKKSSYIFSFANISASIANIFSKILGLKLVIYSYEPHSEFMKDLGLWSSNSLKYKTLRFFEHMAGRNAEHVMTGTKYGVELLTQLNSKAQLYRAPTAVDPKEFYFRKWASKKIRTKLKLKNQHIFLYIGKFGDLYYKEEVIDLMSGIYSSNPNSFFIIVTNYDHGKIEEWFAARNIRKNSFFLTQSITNEEVKEYISASDIGISAVPPNPSQKYRSPTKIAEYLLCGLPYITCRGVSEDDYYAERESVGVVVENFTKQNAIQAYPLIEKLITESKEELRHRCRTTGLNYRSKERIDLLLKEIFE